VGGVGLADGEDVAADDGAEAVQDAQGLQEELGRALGLVGAQAERAAGVGREARSSAAPG
jgi:hypothetical protein